MRSLLIALTSLIMANATAADRIEGLDFADGQTRSEASFAGQMVCMVYFSGECPTARAWMGSEVKSVHDWFEQQHINATLVLVTPDVAASDLIALDQDRDYHMVHALYANDPANQENISLQNIFQVRLLGASGGWSPVNPRPLMQSLRQSITRISSAMAQGDGSVSPESGTNASATDPMAPPPGSAGTGHYHIDNAGLTDPEVVALWWGAERCRPGANKTILAEAKRAHDGAQIKTLADRLSAYYASREQTVIAGPPTIQTLEALETLLMEGDGLPLKLAHQAGHDLMRAPALKLELRARDAYRQFQPLVRSQRRSDQDNGRDGLTQIVQGAPNTVYGQKAAALLRSLPTERHDGN